MPEPPSERIGWPWPFQWLKSPMTRTPRAFGAQTANEVPVMSPEAVLAEIADVRPQHAPQFLVPSLTDQVQVEFAQRGQVPVRVVGDRLGAGDAVRAGVGDGDPVRRGRAGPPACRRARWPRTRPGARAPSGTGGRPRAGPRRSRRTAGACGSRTRPARGARRGSSAGRGGAGDDALDLAQVDPGGGRRLPRLRRLRRRSGHLAAAGHVRLRAGRPGRVGGPGCRMGTGLRGGHERWGWSRAPAEMVDGAARYTVVSCP